MRTDHNLLLTLKFDEKRN